MNQPIRMLCTILVVMAAAFCFTGIAIAGDAPKIDSCSYLTRTEIQAVIGQSVDEGKPNANANPAVGSPCEYRTASGGVFSILVKAVGPSETADKTMEGLKKMKIAVSEAPGIGDRSFFSSPGYGMLQLNTFEGSRYLIITMMLPGVAEGPQKAAAEKLMGLALTKK